MRYWGVVRREKGFALPAVAFLIVIVALIIAALQRINSNQTATSSMGLQSSRAYYAAYSGVEWAAYQVRTTNICPTGTLADRIQGFEISIEDCGKTDYLEGTKTVSMYEIRVLAAYGGKDQYGSNPDFASREITVSMVIE
ncbi:hypothetical protein [Litoribrevibacter albus]|uniref:MSHA biogenesis protein MshP n=1 Tax=Litoribrevibacter albus TaxID=1473156 RepID=A0AA37SDN6_9GAMM|nr:hypothetical protein [Litoribrevibacter albus]GLQ33504.1 hypothetical protein GCM10007876_39840 [Litoribrevibacter albus]